jgi:hypothetical protein
MRRYRTDQFGMISSFDIAEALRRAEARRLDDERRERERVARRAERAGWFARLRGIVPALRSAA